jgi:hypothetical protein
MVIFIPILCTNIPFLFTRNMPGKEIIQILIQTIHQILAIHQSSPHLVETVISIVQSLTKG